MTIGPFRRSMPSPLSDPAAMDSEGGARGPATCSFWRESADVLSESEVQDLVAALKRLAVEGAARAEIPALAGVLKEVDVALMAELLGPPEHDADDDALRVVMTVQEVADELQVPRGAVYELCRTRTLGSFRVGKHVRIRRRALDEYLERVDDEVYRMYTYTSGRRRTPRRPKKPRANATTARRADGSDGDEPGSMGARRGADIEARGELHASPQIDGGPESAGGTEKIEV